MHTGQDTACRWYRPRRCGFDIPRNLYTRAHGKTFSRHNENVDEVTTACRKKVKFLTKLLHSGNIVCSLFADSINRELANLAANLT